MPSEISRQYQKFTQAVNSKLARTINKDQWIDIRNYITEVEFKE